MKFCDYTTSSKIFKPQKMSFLRCPETKDLSSKFQYTFLLFYIYFVSCYIHTLLASKLLALFSLLQNKMQSLFTFFQFKKFKSVQGIPFLNRFNFILKLIRARVSAEIQATRISNWSRLWKKPREKAFLCYISDLAVGNANFTCVLYYQLHLVWFTL